MIFFLIAATASTLGLMLAVFAATSDRLGVAITGYLGALGNAGVLVFTTYLFLVQNVVGQ